MASPSAHAFIKSGRDKYAVQAWSAFIALLFALPFAFWIGLPEPAIRPWLALGWVLHTAYYLTLIWSYSTSDYSVAYPLARGITPILATVLGIAFLGDHLGVLTLAGVGVISTGVLMLAFNRGSGRSGLYAAGVSGLLNAVFSIVDAKGMRVAENPANFLVWYYVIDGIAMPLILVWRTRGTLGQVARTDARTGIATGIGALFAFLPTLIAFRIAPVGAVSAIRATSVIFSLFLGGGLLKEQLDARRIGGALLVTIGAITIIASTALT